MNSRNLNNVIQNTAVLNNKLTQLTKLFWSLSYEVNSIKEKLSKIVPDDSDNSESTQQPVQQPIKQVQTRSAPPRQMQQIRQINKVPVL